MRFEKLEFFDQVAFLENLHRKLNRELFASKLSEIPIDIQNLNKEDNSNYVTYARYTRQGRNCPEQIRFSHECIDFVSEAATQRLQVELLTTVLLHEMTHQYCAMIGVNDHNHVDEWAQIAFEHGLYTCYYDGFPCDGDCLLDTPLSIAKRTQIKVYKRWKENRPSCFSEPIAMQNTMTLGR